MTLDMHQQHDTSLRVYTSATCHCQLESSIYLRLHLQVAVVALLLQVPEWKMLMKTGLKSTSRFKWSRLTRRHNLQVIKWHDFDDGGSYNSRNYNLHVFAWWFICFLYQVQGGHNHNTQRQMSYDRVRRIVQEEGRSARNLLNWNVPVIPDNENRNQQQLTSSTL